MKRVIAMNLALSLLGVLTMACADQRRNTQGPSTRDAACNISFAGKARKDVKLRSPDQNYPKQENGRPLTVAGFLDWVCALDAQVPDKIPQRYPMDLEKVEVAVDAYIVAMKFDDDNDFHIQIADEPRPDADQIIVEVPPGEAYCTGARRTAFQLFKDDGGVILTRHQFKRPPKVHVVGYLFLDSNHREPGSTNYCEENGGRGMKLGTGESHVRGLWEIHPVIELKKAE